MGTILALVFGLVSYYIVHVLSEMSDDWEGERLAAYHGVFIFVNCFAGDNAIRKSCIGFIPATCQWAYDKCIGNEEDPGNRVDGRDGRDPLLGDRETLPNTPPQATPDKQHGGPGPGPRNINWSPPCCRRNSLAAIE